MNYMSIKEFREAGFLQEVNRCFLHPLGLALEVAVEPDGTARLRCVRDARDDPEGIIYESLDASDTARAAQVEALRQQKAKARFAALGYVVQPLPGPWNGIELPVFEP